VIPVPVSVDRRSKLHAAGVDDLLHCDAATKRPTGGAAYEPTQFSMVSHHW
jgi:hypothetical protein